MFKVLVIDPLSPQGIDILRQADDVKIVEKTGLSPEKLIKEIKDVDALLVRSQSLVTSKVIQAAKRLKVIGRAGVGVDNIDVAAATGKGIIVINAPDGNTISTAEHTFALLIALARNIPQAYQSLVRNEWERSRFVGVELRDKRLGIIGLGRIGVEVAKRAKAFYMDVIAYDPYLTPDRAEKLGIRQSTLDEVIQTSDFITVHTPLTKETRHLLNNQAFERMKPGVRILNCARGGIIDEGALLKAIQTGKVAGAAIDVFETEPPGEHPLLQLPQVIATPHLGASTQEAQENVAVDVCMEVLHILRGEPFKNAVNLPSIPADLQEKLRPYQSLAENLGCFALQAAQGPLCSIIVTYSGELTDLDPAPLTRTILKGALSTYLSNVNDVNATFLAKERGIRVTEQKISDLRGFTNLITVEVVTDRERKTVAGTLLNGLGARIVNIDGYPVDVLPRGHLLLIQHRDQPGAIGRVGTLLGKHDINIATMQVGRQNVGGQAIMMLSVDKPVPPEIRQRLAQLEYIDNVKEIDL